MRLIYENPLRVLGVFANASLREVEQNKAQLRAFARVGQEVQLSLWLNGLRLLPPLTAVTEEQLTQAQTQLTLQAERDRWSLFWFERDQEHAEEEQHIIELLNSNRVDEARMAWQQRTDHAAQKNLLLLAVMTEDWKEVAVRAALCFHDNLPHFRCFMDEVVMTTFQNHGPHAHGLLEQFTEEPWSGEMKRVYVNRHKQVLDEAINTLKFANPFHPSLLRNEIEIMMENMEHLKALQELLGPKSFTCFYYGNEAAKVLIKALSKYCQQFTIKSEITWAADLAEQMSAYLSDSEPERRELLAMIAVMKQGFGINVPNKIQTSSGCSGSGCLEGFLLWLIFVLVSLFSRTCEGDKKREPVYDPYKYRPVLTFPDYPSKPAADPSKQPKPGYIRIQGRDVPIDSLLREHEKIQYVPQPIEVPPPATIDHEDYTLDSLMKLVEEQEGVTMPAEKTEPTEDTDSSVNETVPEAVEEPVVEEPEEPYEATDSTMIEQ